MERHLPHRAVVHWQARQYRVHNSRWIYCQSRNRLYWRDAHDNRMWLIAQPYFMQIEDNECSAEKGQGYIRSIWLLECSGWLKEHFCVVARAFLCGFWRVLGRKTISISLLDVLDQGSPTLLLESYCPADFSSNPNQTHLEPPNQVVQGYLIITCRCIESVLELKSARW